MLGVARDENCTMTSKERKGVYGGRKGSQRKHLQLARAPKGKIFESSTRLSRHSPRFGDDSTSSLAVRSIIFISTTTITAGSDTTLAAFIFWFSPSLNYTADNLGEISKLLVSCAEFAKTWPKLPYRMHSIMNCINNNGNKKPTSFFQCDFLH